MQHQGQMNRPFDIDIGEDQIGHQQNSQVASKKKGSIGKFDKFKIWLTCAGQLQANRCREDNHSTRNNSLHKPAWATETDPRASFVELLARAEVLPLKKSSVVNPGIHNQTKVSFYKEPSHSTEK